MSATLQLRSSDEKEFLVELDVIAKSKTINTMMKDLGLDGTSENPVSIPLPNVKSDVLEKILEWCRQHKDDTTPEKQENSRSTEVPEWDKQFLTIGKSDLLSILMAANYLDIPVLLDYSCQMVANELKNKDHEEIRTEWEIKNDFTEEDIENIQRENVW